MLCGSVGNDRVSTYSQRVHGANPKVGHASDHAAFSAFSCSYWSVLLTAVLGTGPFLKLQSLFKPHEPHSWLASCCFETSGTRYCHHYACAIHLVWSDHTGTVSFYTSTRRLSKVRQGWERKTIEDKATWLQCTALKVFSLIGSSHSSLIESGL